MIFYEHIGAAARNSRVLDMKREAEQFQSIPINLLEMGQKYLLINSVKSCKEIQLEEFERILLAYSWRSSIRALSSVSSLT